MKIRGLKMKQFDVVRISNNAQIKGISGGQVGTILEVYSENYFEVEVCDNNGITLFQGALNGDILKIV